ncbi:MAG: DUF3775 domain-containing protein [Pseudomonadota bacterium]
MIDVSTEKVARVIALSRENGPDDDHLHDYIGSFNDDEKAELVALMWVGRETFSPAEIGDAKRVARYEASVPTENYLSGIPELAEYLEDGMDMLGINVMAVEAAL